MISRERVMEIRTAVENYMAGREVAWKALPTKIETIELCDAALVGVATMDAPVGEVDELDDDEMLVVWPAWGTELPSKLAGQRVRIVAVGLGEGGEG